MYSQAWDCDCEFNKTITVDYAGTVDLVDYQLRLDIPFEANMSNDYSNLRFVDADGVTMPHWVEVFDATSAVVWVRVPLITSPSTLIYLLYGGVNCVKDTWVQSDVFIFYDEMDDITAWTTIGTGAVGAGTLDGSSVVSKQTNCDPDGGWRSIGASLDNFRLITREQRATATSDAGCSLNRYGLENSSFNGYNINRNATEIVASSFGYEARTAGSASNSSSTNLSQDIDTWVRTELIHQESGNNIAVLYDDAGDLVGSVSGSMSLNYTDFDRITLRGGHDYSVDFMAIAQYADVHPTVSIGTEQEALIPVVEDDRICIGSSTTLTASGISNCERYIWYDAAVGGNILKISADNNDNTFTTPVLNATTDYWVSSQNVDLDESDRVQLTVTVVENDTVPHLATKDTTILFGDDVKISISPIGTWEVVAFNGTDAEINIPNHADINTSTHSARTIAFWFQANDLWSRQLLFEEGGSTNGFSFYLEGSTLIYHAFENNSSWGTVQVTIEQDTWYHVAMVYDGAAPDDEHIKAYFNGEYEGGFSGPLPTGGASMSTHGGAVNIGASDGNLRYHDNSISNWANHFDGSIDEFKLWNRVLDETEVAFEMDNRNDGTQSGTDLIVYYNFDDASTVTDLATANGGSNNGVISGALDFVDNSGSAMSYLWTPGGMTDSSITVSPDRTTEYTYFIESDDYLCETAGSITVVVDRVETDSVTSIGKTTARFYGFVSGGFDIVEYGFLYSTDIDEANLTVANGATAVKTYEGVAIDLISHSFNSDISALGYREAYYLRSYTKDDGDNYAYGNTIRFITEQRDFSLVLDGAGDAVVVDSTTTDTRLNNWGVNDTIFSLEFWMKKGSSETLEQVICFNEDGTDGYTVSLTNGDIVLSTPDGSSVSSAQKIDDEMWHYVAIAYDNGFASIYVDDTTSTAQAITINRPSTKHFIIGAGENAGVLQNEFEGYIDGLRFWKTPITPLQINELLHDNIREGGVTNTVVGEASERAVSSLSWADLTASLGFNVLSRQEGMKSYPADLDHTSQATYHDYPFFQSDVFGATDKSIFNVLAIGNAKPSPYLPRVYWRATNVDNDWLNSDNWSAYAYPGEGVVALDYPDVTSADIADDDDYCDYTIVDASDNSAIIGTTPPEVLSLIDREEGIGTYRVDNSASELSILNGVYYNILDVIVDANDATIVITEGAVEAHE